METPYSLVALKMVTPMEGWAGGAIYSARSFTALFFHTVDGGESWEEIQTDMDYTVWSIDGVDPNLLFSNAFNTAATALLKYTR